MENVRIAVLDPYDNLIGFMDNSADDALHYYDDELHTYLTGSAYTFDFKTYADYEDIDILAVGNHLSFVRTNADGREKGYYLNIVSVENDGIEVMVECYGLLFELITEDIQAYRAESAMSFIQYVQAFGFDNTIINIGLNEVSDKRITHEWSGSDTVLSRLYSLATVFDAEVAFVTEINEDYSLRKLTMNVYRAHDDTNQGMGTDRSAEVLRFGDELSVIRSKEDISELYTAIRPKGSDELSLTGLEERKVYDDDGELLYWHPAGSNVIFAPQAKERYPATALSTADGWIAHNWDYQTDNIEVLYGQALAQLKKNSVPQVSYTVEGFIDAEIGDTFTLADERRNLYVEARIVEQIICFTDGSRNKTTFDNFTTLRSQVSDSMMERMAQMIEASRMFTGLILSSNGTAFKNNTGSTVLTARVMDGIRDATDDMAIQWFRDGSSLSIGKTVTVTASQVADKAVYRFDAYKNGVLKATAEVTITDVSDGANGDDGITPTITVSKSDTITTVTVTTGEDVQSAQILDGQKGDTGEPGPQGPQGIQGDTGTKGTSVSSIVPEYYLSTSKTEQTGGTWSTSPPTTWTSGMYLWTRNKIIYTDPAGLEYTAPTCDYAWEQAVRGVNLSPFYSHDITDVYNASTNPDGYWFANHATQNANFTVTQIGDGWMHIHCDNSNGTATIRDDVCHPVAEKAIIPGSDYTFLVEIKNNTSSAVSNTTDTYIVQTNNKQFFGDTIKKNLEGIGATSSGTDIMNVPTDGSLYTKRFVKTAEPSNSSHWTTLPTGLCNITFRCAAGDIIDYDYRISIYEGEYTGPYVPYTISDVSAIRKNAEVAKNLELGGRNLLKASNVLLSNATYAMGNYYFGDLPPQEGEHVTIRIKGELGSDRTHFGVYNSGGNVAEVTRTAWKYDELTGIYSATVPWQVTQGSTTAANTYIRIYQMPQSGTSTSTIEWIKLERGNKATDWTPAPEDVESDIEYGKTQVYERVSADLQPLSDSIQAIVSKNYYTVDEANELVTRIQQMSTQLVQTASQITALITSVDTAQSTADGAASTLSTWFNFDSQGLGIGKSDSGVNMLLTNDRLGFYLNGAEVAYLSESKLYITDGTFLGSLQLGNFAFVPNHAGNLSFKKVTQ